MADGEQVAMLRQGVAAWNTWRHDNPNLQPDLIRVTLEGTDFSGINLSRANLSHVLHWRAAQLSAAYWDEQTIWPDGYPPPHPQRRP